jgi:nitrite reductase/ring-hydroxylating ferredoxin subunit
VSPHRAVARVSDLAPGHLMPVQVDGIEMIVYWLGARVYAAQRRCLHQGADLADGLIQRGAIVCAQHGWRFDAETGVHEMSSENCLVTYRAWIEGDEIMIDTTPIRRAAVPQ